MKKRRPKTSTKLVPATCDDEKAPLNPPKPATEVTRATAATQTPISANHGPTSSLSSQQSQDSDVQNRKSEEKVVYDDAQELELIDSDNNEESEEKTGSDDENGADQAEWTQVSRRRKRVNLPPCWKLRFPAHLRAGLHTPSESSSSLSSSGDESDPGSTPVAARTRSKLKT